jgi:hypothetical protein
MMRLVPDCDDVIESFLTLLRRVNQLLHVKAIALRQEPGWSEVTCELTFINAPAGDRTEVWGYVDRELDPVGGVAWHVRIRRGEANWVVERDMTLNANDVPHRGQVVIAALAPSPFIAVADLVDALPPLVTELLDLPAPRQGA